MNIPPEVSSALFGALGTAGAFLIRRAARWISWRWFRAKVRKEARAVGGPEIGTVAWVYRWAEGEILRERGARHALQEVVRQQGVHIGRLMGRSDSGEQARVTFENDTDPAPPMVFSEPEPRTPVDGAIARARRRSRP